MKLYDLGSPLLLLLLALLLLSGGGLTLLGG